MIDVNVVRFPTNEHIVMSIQPHDTVSQFFKQLPRQWFESDKDMLGPTKAYHIQIIKNGKVQEKTLLGYITRLWNLQENDTLFVRSFSLNKYFDVTFQNLKGDKTKAPISVLSTWSYNIYDIIKRKPGYYIQLFNGKHKIEEDEEVLDSFLNGDGNDVITYVYYPIY